MTAARKKAVAYLALDKDGHVVGTMKSMPYVAAREDAHLTTEELAERLRVPAETVKRWRKPRYSSDGPKWFYAGRHVRYRLADVEAWEKSRLQPA